MSILTWAVVGWRILILVVQTRDCSLCGTPYFQYDGSIYEQQESAAMHSAVSPVVANLYMEDFEEQALESMLCMPNIWKCHVDGTFIILSQDKVNSLTVSN